MRNDDSRPVPKAKAEVVAALGALLHDVRAAWTVAGIVVMSAYFTLVPVRELLAEVDLLILVLPGVSLGALAPVAGSLLGEAHARRLARRRLPVLIHSAARKYGASPVELAPAVHSEVVALLRGDGSP